MCTGAARYTVGRVLIARFNDCILGQSGQIANPIIAMVDPIPYILYAHIYVCESINCECRKYSQFAINRNSQLKTNLRYHEYCILPKFDIVSSESPNIEISMPYIPGKHIQFWILNSKGLQITLEHWIALCCMLSENQALIDLKYHMAGNFCEVFDLVNWWFCGNSPNLKAANIISYTVALCESARNRQI